MLCFLYSFLARFFLDVDGFGLHFGALMATLEASKSCLFKERVPRWSPRGLLDRFWDHLDRFWDQLGPLWEGFGRFGGDFWKALGRYLEERWQETLRKRIDMNPFRNFNFWTKWLTLCVGCNKMQTEFGTVLEECT